MDNANRIDTPYIAHTPEKPPAGTYWGDMSYQVAGYSVCHHDRHGKRTNMLTHSHNEFQEAKAEARKLAEAFAEDGGDWSVLMQVNIVI
ncbi:hypothetical protein D3227_25825 [Mesorhizobium waimense]|uniref:Uncharacterized protein n=1 Tax=Mesorhizobium waimense TaxID=1300307 RepID=A0A3A5KCX3_9HYPH|nr:hypothetical protein [Mesorhizobium waimense]RJT32818.1 hypothetical protein D3227_25825 [Mesorhizobium waimense]